MDNFKLLDFYKALNKAIKIFNCSEEYKKYNSLRKTKRLLLQNNGCGIADKIYSHIVPIGKNYNIEFIKGISGNAANIYFDYLEMDTCHLFIFMDYFDGINDASVPDDPIEAKAKELIGRSLYSDIIEKLVNTYIVTTVNPAVFTSDLSTTVLGGVVRYAPKLIAAKILNNISPITENDVSGIELEYLKSMILDNDKFAKSLYGVRIQDGE